MPSGLLTYVLFTKILCIFLTSPLYATCATHLILPYLIILTKFGEECWKLWISILLQSPPSSCHLLLSPNISLSILFVNMLSLCFSSSVRDHNSYPYSSRITLLKIKYLLSGKPSSWLPRKLKLVMHDVLRKSLRFPRVTLKKSRYLYNQFQWQT